MNRYCIQFIISRENYEETVEALIVYAKNKHNALIRAINLVKDIADYNTIFIYKCNVEK